nr:putative heat shock protein 70 family [Tanacetum cinerariifolium]
KWHKSTNQALPSIDRADDAGANGNLQQLVIATDNQCLGVFRISGIPPGLKGFQSIKEYLKIDVDGILTVTTEILSTDAVPCIAIVVVSISSANGFLLKCSNALQHMPSCSISSLESRPFSFIMVTFFVVPVDNISVVTVKIPSTSICKYSLID